MKPISQQTILITGASDGLGKVTALALAKQGANVILHGRDSQRLEASKQAILQETSQSSVETYLADFADLSQVRQLAEAIQAKHPQLDMLINNAGIGGGKLGEMRREVSQDGYELRFAVNYLAPFLLTHLLLPTLTGKPPTRIINVGSIGQSPLDFKDVMLERHYDPGHAYRQSKLALAMFTFDLAEQVKGTGITVNCLHPASLMNTRMVYESVGYTMSTVEEGRDALLYLATSPELDSVTGKYFDQQRQARANSQAYDMHARRQLQQLSEQLTNLNSQKAT